jgi:hypothetical protein
MSNADKTETIRMDLRAALANLLSHAPVRERFRAKVAAWCKWLVESDKPGAVPVDTGVAASFGPVGSSAMIAALMKRGPQDLDEAYVLLGAIHDAGPHVGRARQALGLAVGGAPWSLAKRARPAARDEAGYAASWRGSSLGITAASSKRKRHRKASRLWPQRRPVFRAQLIHVFILS